MYWGRTGYVLGTYFFLHSYFFRVPNVYWTGTMYSISLVLTLYVYLLITGHVHSTY